MVSLRRLLSSSVSYTFQLVSRFPSLRRRLRLLCLAYLRRVGILGRLDEIRLLQATFSSGLVLGSCLVRRRVSADILSAIGGDDSIKGQFDSSSVDSP
jgi:hypothetical protein